MSKLLLRLKQTFKSKTTSPAVTMGLKTLTYQDLDMISDRMALNLINLYQIETNDIVAISLPKSLEQICLLISLVKIGATYLPIDLDLPAGRADYILNHSKAKLQITQDILTNILNKNTQDTEITTLAEHNFYLLYTSGSTGTPKGVTMGSSALNHLLEWQSKETNLNESSITLQYAPLGFDVHFQEIFSTFFDGGHLILISESSRKNMTELIEIINKNKINRIYLPFVAFNLLSEILIRTNKSILGVCEITVAGEQLKITPYIRKFFETHKTTALFNHYGPTETHVVTSLKLDPQMLSAELWPELPSIGKATGENKIFIVDTNLNPVSQGEQGELIVAGPALAEGYHLNEAETEKRFIVHPIYGRIYKTNDLARRLSNDEFEFLGRSDRQVKIRGHRVELSEIESQILKITKALACGVITTNTNNTVYIKAFVAGTNLTTNNIKDALKNTLPEFMIPDVIEIIQQMPLTSSGKIDYQNLNVKNEITTNNKIESSTYDVIVNIWRKYLPLPKFDSTTSFFDLGGHSLTMAQMLLDVNEAFKLDLDLVEIFENNTVEKLATLCEQKATRFAKHESLNNDIKKYSQEKIAVIATHGHFPDSADVTSLWENLLALKNLVKTFDAKDTHPLTEITDNHVFASGEYPDGDTFDNEYFGISLLEAQLMDPQQRKFLELCHEALFLSGYPSSKDRHVHKNTGIFAGMSSSRYGDLVRHYPEKIEILGTFATSLGLEKDYLATRVAHKLNLGGPALNINTACSTSLVAIIQAVESLRANKCDMAIAGGIAIANLEKEGHSHNSGSIYSENNECRVFDAHSTGTIFTHGSAVVVLKRLSDAERDNDNIVGLISGVGLSNDGADKMSFMAPSIEGQADAILKAQTDAGISPEQLLFIEAHGTGTPIGDPAEVTGLTRAFRENTHLKNYCYLSSLKANVGHLNAASGASGLIKALHSLRTKILPGQILIDQINPLIKISDSPFKISKTNILLENSATKKYAGVSSFGVGGTNAHVIIEDYKTQKNDEYIVLVFSGHGSQYENLGQSFYNEFNDKLTDEIKELNLALDRNGQAAIESIFTSKDKDLTTQQLQLFIYQYLSAKLVLKTFNFKKISLIGCSLGEITAACLTELISLDNALSFISKRTSLLNHAPTGAMLLLNLDISNELQAMAQFNVEVGITYSSSLFVATGLINDIENYKQSLDKRGINSLWIESHYPYHSSQLKGFENEIRKITKDFRLNKNSYELIQTGASNFNINEIDYWTTHHTQEVRFNTAIENHFKDRSDLVFVEIGPQNFLNQQIQKNIRTTNSNNLFISIASHSSDNETKNILTGVNKLAEAIASNNLKRKTEKFKKYNFKKTKINLPALKTRSLLAMETTSKTSDSVLAKQLLTDIQSELGFTIDNTISDVYNTHFLELGLDSLMLTQMSAIVKSKYKISVSFRDLKEKYCTTNSLSQLITEKNPVKTTTQSIPSTTTSAAASVAVAAPVSAPAAVPASMPTSNNPTTTNKTIVTSTSALENIMQMQLQLMQEQIRLLGGQPAQNIISTEAVNTTINKKSEDNVKPAPFGAQAKINLHSTYTTDARIRENMKSFEKKYNHKTSLSKDFAQRSRKAHADPRSVSGFRPETKELTYPIVVKKSEGNILTDVNDNNYIDMLCGFGSNFFGNSNSKITEALTEQIKTGIEVGPQNSLAYDAAQLVIELTGNERVAFCNTGSEAVLGAIRIARTVTAKKKIITFSGSYHGINDDVIVRAGNAGQTIPAASGITSDSVSNTIVLDYGEQSSLDYIRDHADDIAGVLVEPVQSRRCNFQPQKFLSDLKTLTENLDICLIFDEIITGFRIQADGAQGYFNIQADLCTYGKIVGGGLPIGIIAGKSKYMNALDGGHWTFGDESYPEDGVTYFAGTFVRHPLALAACKAALEIIKNGKNNIYKDLNQKSNKFVAELNSYFEAESFPLTFDQFGSLMKPRWTKAPIASEVFFALIRYHGVHTYDGFPWFVNLAHTEAQLQEVIGAIKKAIIDMKSLGLFKSEYAMASLNFVETKTPRTFIGKDDNGYPATFSEDLNNPGAYIQIKSYGE